MGRPQRRKKHHFGDTHLKRKWRTRSRKRDLDQIDDDLKDSPEKLIDQEIDFDEKGFGQHYCVHCARYFTDDHAMKTHFRSKVHKRRLKALEMEPYSIEESEKAAGRGCYQEAKVRDMKTQPTKDEIRAGKKILIEVKDEDNEMKS